MLGCRPAANSVLGSLNMTLSIRIFALAAVAWASGAHGVESMPSAWPAHEKVAAVAGCRLSITNNATSDYLARHKLKPGDLPKDFNARMAPVLEPYLATCDCVIAALERQFPIEAFKQRTTELQQRAQALGSPGGACAPPPKA